MLNGIEDSIIESLANVLFRSSKINKEDQLALQKEYKEWLSESSVNEEILVIDEHTFQNLK